MDNPTQYDDFLDAVNELRGDDNAVQITAHTSNVAASGWAPSDDTAADDTADDK